MTPLIAQFEAESDPARRRQIAGELNKVAIERRPSRSPASSAHRPPGASNSAA
jgi:peptide/nickel transport system substrate-binding protein